MTAGTTPGGGCDAIQVETAWRMCAAGIEPIGPMAPPRFRIILNKAGAEPGFSASMPRVSTIGAAMRRKKVAGQSVRAIDSTNARHASVAQPAAGRSPRSTTEPVAWIETTPATCRKPKLWLWRGRLYRVHRQRPRRRRLLAIDSSSTRKNLPSQSLWHPQARPSATPSADYARSASQRNARSAISSRSP